MKVEKISFANSRYDEPISYRHRFPPRAFSNVIWTEIWSDCLQDTKQPFAEMVCDQTTRFTRPTNENLDIRPLTESPNGF